LSGSVLSTAAEKGLPQLRTWTSKIIREDSRKVIILRTSTYNSIQKLFYLQNTYCKTNCRAKIRPRNASDVVAQSIKSTFQGKSNLLKASATLETTQLIGSRALLIDRNLSTDNQERPRKRHVGLMICKVSNAFAKISFSNRWFVLQH
jgi:hypothetical protein